MIFQTKRLGIRNLCETDLENLFLYRNDKRCYMYQRYSNTSKDYLHSFIIKYSNCHFLSKEEEQHYAIVLHENCQIIGDLSVFYTAADNCFTLGITIDPLYQNNGYAYEILSGVISLIIKQYPSIDIVALIEKDNYKSISLFEKLHFIRETYVESADSYIYVIYGKKIS